MLLNCRFFCVKMRHFPGLNPAKAAYNRICKAGNNLIMKN